MQPLRFFMYARKSQESDERQELSIPAQLDELRRLATSLDITIIGDPFQEAQTARKPGRPLFNEMMSAIEAGRADGILCWKLDRLARNLIDGGRVVYNLGQGVIKKIITPGRVYVGDSTEKLMMTFEFGTATKYSDDISDNVKRSNRAYLARGAWTGCPKLGYLREVPEATSSHRERRGLRLVRDPVRFPILRSMWTMLLDGDSPLDILATARRWNLTTPQRGRNGGRLISQSALYRMFRDEFYTGIMIRAGERYQGSHEPLVTRAEFDRAQELLDARLVSTSRAKTLFFPYRGHVRCGSCGSIVTARRLTKPSGKSYIYYHCYRKSRRYRYCPEPAVDERTIDAALEAFVRRLVIPTEWLTALQAHLEDLAAGRKLQLTEDARQIEAQVARLTNRRERLRELLLDEVVTLTDYQQDVARLDREVQRLRESQRIEANPRGYLEPWITAATMLKQAPDWITDATQDEKKRLVKTLACNLQLMDRKVLIRAKKSFSAFANWDKSPTMQAWLDHVDNEIADSARGQATGSVIMPVADKSIPPQESPGPDPKDILPRQAPSPS